MNKGVEMYYKIVVGLLLLLISSSLLAQEEELPSIGTDRPGQYFAVSTVSKGYVQLETGIGLDLLDSSHTFALSATDLRYGLTKNFELRSGFRLNSTKLAQVDDMVFEGALTAGFKWQLLNKKVKLAYLAEASIPIYPSIVSAYHLFLLQHNVGKRVNFNYMLLHQYDFSQLPLATYGGGLQFSFAAGFSLTKRISFYIELSGMWDSANVNAYRILYDAGICYLIKKNLQLDFFFGHGINYKQGTYGIGISWRPKKLKQAI